MCTSVLLPKLYKIPYYTVNYWNEAVNVYLKNHHYQWLSGGYDLEIGHFQKWLAYWLPGGSWHFSCSDHCTRCSYCLHCFSLGQQHMTQLMYRPTAGAGAV